MQKLANFIQNKLDEKKWTQSDLSRVSGMSRQLVNYLMTEKSKSPTRDTVGRLAKAFKIPVEDIYREIGVLPPKEDPAPVIKATAHVMSELDEKDQADVLEYARMRQRLAEERGNSGAAKRLTTPRNS